MDFVTIGNPNNAADTTGSPNPVGSVAYTYNIGKYEVSRDMVLKASSDGGLGLTLADMTSYGGNGASHPATGISWNEAARFVNYLNTSKGYQAAYNFTTVGQTQTLRYGEQGSTAGAINFATRMHTISYPTRMSGTKRLTEARAVRGIISQLGATALLLW